MFTHLSPHKKYQPKIVNLQINFLSQKLDHNMFTRKVRKMGSYRSTQRCLKILNAIQHINFHTAQPEPSDIEIKEIIRNQNVKSQSKNSYLAYKQEQKRQKQTFNSRISYMKNKFKNHRKKLEISRQKCFSSQKVMAKTFDSLTKRRSSLVNFNENLGELNDFHSPHKSRIYIKNSEGKRQRINADTYLSHIKQKMQFFQFLEPKQKKDSSKYLFSFSKGDHLSKGDSLEYTIANIRKRRIQMSRSKGQLNMGSTANILEKGQDCRPWSSNKSEILLE